MNNTEDMFLKMVSKATNKSLMRFRKLINLIKCPISIEVLPHDLLKQKAFWLFTQIKQVFWTCTDLIVK